VHESWSFFEGSPELPSDPIQAGEKSKGPKTKARDGYNRHSILPVFKLSYKVSQF